MIDVELMQMWFRGVGFGLLFGVFIRELGEWVRSRRTKRAADGATCACEAPVMQSFKFGWLCVECGKPPRR